LKNYGHFSITTQEVQKENNGGRGKGKGASLFASPLVREIALNRGKGLVITWRQQEGKAGTRESVQELALK